MNFIDVAYFKKLLSSMLTKGFSSFIKVGSVALLIKLLGVDDYGIYIIGMSVFLLLQTISRIGVDLYIQQQAARYKHDTAKLSSFVGVILISSLVSLFVMYIATTLLKYYANGVAENIWIYFIYAAPFYSICWNFTYLLRGLEKVTESIVLMELSLPILQLIIFVVGYYYFSWGVKEAVLSLMLASAISSVVLISLFVYKKNYSINVDLKYYCKTLKHSKTFLAISVSSMLLVWSDTYLISYYMQPEAVALYSIISKLGMIILIPVGVVTVYTNNFTSEWYKRLDSFSELKKKLTINIVIISIILLFLVSFLLIISSYVFDYFNVNYTANLQMALTIYLLAQCVFAINGPIDSIFLMGTRQDIVTKINMVMVVVNVMLCALLIPIYGLIGASLSTLISVMIAKSAQLYILNNLYKK